MTYADVPVALVLGDQLILCDGHKLSRYKLPARRQAGTRAIEVARGAFADSLRDAIRADHAPAWCFG